MTLHLAVPYQREEQVLLFWCVCVLFISTEGRETSLTRGPPFPIRRQLRSGSAVLR